MSFRFYVECFDPQHEVPTGNVLAIDETSHKDGFFEGYVPVYNYPDSPVIWGEISAWWRQVHCIRCDEAQARRIHPLLFEALDAGGVHV